MDKHKCCMYGDKCKPATMQIATRNGGEEWYCDECARVMSASNAFRTIVRAMEEKEIEEASNG